MFDRSTLTLLAQFVPQVLDLPPEFFDPRDPSGVLAVGVARDLARDGGAPDRFEDAAADIRHGAEALAVADRP